MVRIGIPASQAGIDDSANIDLAVKLACDISLSQAADPVPAEINRLALKWMIALSFTIVATLQQIERLWFGPIGKIPSSTTSTTKENAPFPARFVFATGADQAASGATVAKVCAMTSASSCSENGLVR
jgi:hypothetical protein